jgi:cellulose synthase/poly-beta-1,6-N-acetylglucosamine synthase-like glycosyltransferase
MQSAFWALIALAGYSYVLYPVLLLLLPTRRSSSQKPEVKVRRISVIIAARNEQAKIAAKIENTLMLHNPGVELEVLVASDASDDRTDDIVRGYADKGVILARSAERNGKEHAQRAAIAASSGDLLVFTDAGTMLPSDALIAINAAFSDANVGALSSVDRVISEDGHTQGEGLYVRYEMWLRGVEARFNTLVGLSGSFFAARRVVCEDWDTRVPSDFGTALNCARLGYKAVSDPAVVGIYKNLADPRREYSRKLRTALRGMVGLRHRSEVLNPLRYGWFSFQVFSHKVMRWGVPWFLLSAWVLNFALLGGSFIYALTLLGLSMLFGAALLLRTIPAAGRISLVRFAGYFVEANVAVMHASIRIALGHTIMTWEPSKR